MPDLWTAFALLAVVLIVSALSSGAVARLPISFPIIFLGLGFLFGERGLGLLHITSHDPGLEVVATLSLAFVLFLDAVRLRFDEGRGAWTLSALALGPGTVLTAGFIALAAALIFGMGPVPCLLLGALLASMDPVVLRDVVNDDRLPRSIRQALGVEAGTNDIVVLPAILVLATIASGQVGSTGDWLALLGKLFLLGPLAGVAVGLASVWLLRLAQSFTSIGREYQAIYGVGIILAAYVAGEGVGGSGFLAVFTAGAVVAARNYELCDCFLEYGDVTSEMAMLLAFILFGALLSTTISTIPVLPAIGFAALVLLAARPLAISLVLMPARLSRPARLFIGWFGPRGLNSLLFALLLVADGVPQAEWLLAVTGVVVIISVVVHGATATPFASWYARSLALETLPEEREGTAAGLFGPGDGEIPRISPAELADRLAGANPPIVLDVRTRSQFAHDQARIPGSVRVLPDRNLEWAAEQPRERAIVAYCT